MRAEGAELAIADETIGQARNHVGDPRRVARQPDVALQLDQSDDLRHVRRRDLLDGLARHELREQVASSVDLPRREARRHGVSPAVQRLGEPGRVPEVEHVVRVHLQHRGRAVGHAYLVRPGTFTVRELPHELDSDRLGQRGGFHGRSIAGLERLQPGHLAWLYV